MRRAKPAALIAAAPVGAPGSCDGLRGEADVVVVLDQPTTFFGVSQFYESSAGLG
jgi:predicted phosphoribosyltransferase